MAVWLPPRWKRCSSGEQDTCRSTYFGGAAGGIPRKPSRPRTRLGHEQETTGVTVHEHYSRGLHLRPVASYATPERLRPAHEVPSDHAHCCYGLVRFLLRL